MLHVNQRAGYTIAVSQARYVAQIAKRTVLCDDALSVLVPVLEDIADGTRRASGASSSRRTCSSRTGEGADRLAHHLLERAGPRRGAGGRMTTAIGWVATALFAASYFFKRQRTLLAIQIVAASV
jgi:hypothetical protein